MAQTDPPTVAHPIEDILSLLHKILRDQALIQDGVTRVEALVTTPDHVAEVILLPDLRVVEAVEAVSEAVEVVVLPEAVDPQVAQGLVVVQDHEAETRNSYS